MKTNPELTKKLSKEFDIIKKIVKEFFDENCCDFYKKDKLMFFLEGNICYDFEQNQWGLSVDHTWLFHWNDDIEDLYYRIQHIFCFITKVTKNVENFAMYEGYFTILNSYDNYCGTLWNSEIEKYEQDNELPWEVAKNVLTQQIIIEKEDAEKEENT